MDELTDCLIDCSLSPALSLTVTLSSFLTHTQFIGITVAASLLEILNLLLSSRQPLILSAEMTTVAVDFYQL